MRFFMGFILPFLRLFSHCLLKAADLQNLTPAKSGLFGALPELELPQNFSQKKPLLCKEKFQLYAAGTWWAGAYKVAY